LNVCDRIEGVENKLTKSRASSVDQKNDLERQLKRLKDYAAAHGYQVSCMVSGIGSGLNDRRPKFLKLLTDPRIGSSLSSTETVARALVLPTLSSF
jgi:predicted site-specific integrase-resolvase